MQISRYRPGSTTSFNERPEVLRVQERNVPLVGPLVILARHVKLLASSLSNSTHTGKHTGKRIFATAPARVVYPVG